MIVARHPGAVKRATSYAERLRLNIAVIHGEEKDENIRDDGPLTSSSSGDSVTAERQSTNASLDSGFKLLPGLLICLLSILENTVAFSQSINKSSP